jgi:hypothetical protein
VGDKRMLRELELDVFGHIFVCFYDYSWNFEDEELHHGWLRTGIYDYLDRLDYQYDQEKFTISDVNNALVNAYKQDDYTWWWLNSYKHSDVKAWEDQKQPNEGMQFVAACAWLEHFGLINIHDDKDWEIIDLYIEKYYHPTFLKLFIKKFVWDVMFPDEALPNYTEPKSGDVRLLNYPFDIDFNDINRESKHKNKE